MTRRILQIKGSGLSWKPLPMGWPCRGGERNGCCDLVWRARRDLSGKPFRVIV